MQLTAPTTMSGSYNICTSGIPGRFAKQIDKQIDDGNTLTGSFRVASVTAPNMALSTAAVDDASKYVLCLAF